MCAASKSSSASRRSSLSAIETIRFGSQFGAFAICDFGFEKLDFSCRYTLFALFWLVWIGMFAGAIAIVIASPRCVAKKAKPWHHSAVAYQIFTPTFRDADGDGVGDFNGIKEKLNDLRRVGVTAIWPSPLLTTNKNDFGVAEIVDGESVDPRFGTESELMALIERAHDLSEFCAFISDARSNAKINLISLRSLFHR